ncbi:HD family phosphohydrolase [Botrimarina mediterranea]|uniref:Ribonuclease Y n=1 Tax=Botrimarina mediterranea TaxID=2528022 RepID=A0A518K2J8_9BACT|nr:HDIG domain-containing metalloprotein [Botrimarina mediterranea]QDV72024.1 Ribonuclease Y [Botrimarina mediterranea]QDV76565.1 Ribonuclease Y [Planctomycetes bacterium K2D]
MVELPPGKFSTLLGQLRRGAVVLRLAIAAVTAALLVVLVRGWEPPRDFALGEIPSRDLTARVEFKQLDDRATRDARNRARRFAQAVYDNDPAPLAQLVAQVRNEVLQLASAESLEKVDQSLWSQYLPQLAEGTPAPTDEEKRTEFERFRTALATEEAREGFGLALEKAVQPLQDRGILDRAPTDANAEQIRVQRPGKESFPSVVPVRDALVDNVRNDLDQSLRRLMPNLEVARHVFARLRGNLPVTLKLNEADTRKESDDQAAQVEAVYRVFQPGDRLAEAGVPLEDAAMTLLELDYKEFLARQSVGDIVGRSLSTYWLYASMLALCGLGLYRSDRESVVELGRYATLLTAFLLASGAMFGVIYFAGPQWRLEMIPLLWLGMTIAVAYRHQSALLVLITTGFIAAIGFGWSVGESVIALAPGAASIILLDSVRHRSKLLLVGFWAGLVAIVTTLSVGAIEGQPLWSTMQLALATGLWPVIAGSLLTVSLPAVERVFNIQTDLSLIELGDPAKPLLQELVRRAPGTYNHSITVASIAEAAAEAIGARSLLVRVGAYYHDIGKMLKPGYFIENQGKGVNSHDALVPAMSTLVIIAHVKDGADLARQNRLPQCIVDFIEQHHGTTLVEYFYRQAQKKSLDQADDSKVDESRFRYPGPKPQTKEAAVLMLADAVESASRSLVEPTPARIESLVEELTRKRLDDGQFDECGVTLQELHTIGESLIKSLTAVYHGRVKYPDQVTA